MFYSFLESVKYTGHLLPIAVLRLWLGFYFFREALLKYNGDFLSKPRLAAQIADALPQIQLSDWYLQMVENVIIPQWQAVSFAVVGLEFTIGISYLLGFVTRPVALLATILCLNRYFLATAETQQMQVTLVAVNIVLFWVGAGRCLGFDYYFFKRQRGLWW